MKNIAIIPVRTGSKRLPDKNVKLFHGQPLFTYTIEYALRSKLFDEIHVSTESKEVADISKEYGVKVPFLRDPEYATDRAQLVDVCRFVLDEFGKNGKSFNNFCLLWATAPMRTDKDIVNSYYMLDDKCNGVMGVSEYGLSVFGAQLVDDRGHLKPLFPDTLKLRSQDQPVALSCNSTLCWVKVNAFKKYKTWLLPKLKGYNMPKRSAIDIDTQFDWDLAEYLFKK